MHIPGHNRAGPTEPADPEMDKTLTASAPDAMTIVMVL
jgi:hypothetical protein